MSADVLGTTDQTFVFFEELADDTTEWFDANRDVFKARVWMPFVAFMEEVTDRLAGTATPLVGGHRTMLRIARDVRFSEDKSPNSLSISGLWTVDGFKQDSGGLAYAELDADGGMVGAGFHKLSATQLRPIRTQMVESPEVMDAVLVSLAEAGLALDDGDSLTAMPRGFEDQTEHRHAAIMKRRSLLVSQPLPKVAWLDDTAPARVAAFIEAAGPLITLTDGGA